MYEFYSSFIVCRFLHSYIDGGQLIPNDPKICHLVSGDDADDDADDGVRDGDDCDSNNNNNNMTIETRKDYQRSP